MRIKHLFKYTVILFIIFLTGCHLKTADVKQDAELFSESVETESVETETVETETVETETVETENVEMETETIETEVLESSPIEFIAVTSTNLKSLAGQISLDQSKLKRQNAVIDETIVFFEPLNALSSQLPITDTAISTQNKQFKPNVLAITKGSTVDFPNMDRILHNVFSVSPISEFDLGLYSAGTSKSVTFNEAGVIYVHCNVHHSMQADILVLDTPYFTQVDKNGYFELNDLPDLAGTLKTWHPRANIESVEITGNSNHQNIQQTVLISRPEVPKHRNKFGNSYRRKRY